MAPPIEPNEPAAVESDLEYYRRRCHALQLAVTGALAVLSVADEGGEQS